MELTGQTALITGAAARIGACLALGLAERGVDIALHCHRSSQAAHALAQRLRQLGRRVMVLTGDLADGHQAAALPASVAAAMGPATLLINNAAIFEAGSVASTDQNQWQRHLAINLTAPFLLLQGFARQLPPEQKGKVINLLDQRLAHPRPGHLAYTVAKSGLLTLTTLAALELAPRILVNAIAPGPILPSNPQDEAGFHKIAAATPAGRAGQPEDILAACLFLLQQDYINGQIIHVDGGQHLT